MPGDRLPPIQGGPGVTGESGTLSATAEVVGLEQEAEQDGLSVADRIALQDADLRQWMTNRMVRAFIWANGVTLGALGSLVVLDEINIGVHLISPADRIVTHQVLMVLLGATTVQVGTIAAIIARYLFPGRSRNG